MKRGHSKFKGKGATGRRKNGGEKNRDVDNRKNKTWGGMGKMLGGSKIGGAVWTALNGEKETAGVGAQKGSERGKGKFQKPGLWKVPIGKCHMFLKGLRKQVNTLKETVTTRKKRDSLKVKESVEGNRGGRSPPVGTSLVQERE